MNLNTLVRQGVIGPDTGTEMIDYLAGRLTDAEEIRRSRQFPYQFLAAYTNASDEQDALRRRGSLFCRRHPAA
jgi:60 kDa SS-A/Ro ribonucleoprotein